MDVVVGHQAPRDDGSLNAAGAAVVDMIAEYQMAARRLFQFVAVFILQSFVGEAADFDAHGN